MHNLAFLTFWLKRFSEQLSVDRTPLSAVLVLTEPSLDTHCGGDGETGRRWAHSSTPWRKRSLDTADFNEPYAHLTPQITDGVGRIGSSNWVSFALNAVIICHVDCYICLAPPANIPASSSAMASTIPLTSRKRKNDVHRNPLVEDLIESNEM